MSQRKCQCFANNREATDAAIHGLIKRCTRAPAAIVIPVRGPLDGFVEGKDFDRLLRADEGMSSPKAWWAAMDKDSRRSISTNRR